MTANVSKTSDIGSNAISSFEYILPKIEVTNGEFMKGSLLEGLKRPEDLSNLPIAASFLEGKK